MKCLSGVGVVAVVVVVVVLSWVGGCESVDVVYNVTK